MGSTCCRRPGKGNQTSSARERLSTRVSRRLGLFGESGAVLAKLYEFEWCVGDGPLFLHMVQGPEWTSLVMSEQQESALLFADPKHAIDLCDEHDDDTPGSVSSKKQTAAKELLALKAAADGSTADAAGGGGGGGGGDVDRSERAANSDRDIHSLAVPAIVPAIESARQKILARLQYWLYME